MTIQLNKFAFKRKIKLLSFVLISFFLILTSTITYQNNNRTIQSVDENDNVVESCEDIVSQFGLNSGRSAFEQEKSWNFYKGKHFKWKLSAVEISEKLSDGRVAVQFNCQNSKSLVRHLIVRFPESMGRFIARISNKKVYTITGEFKEFSPVFGIKADVY